MRKEVSASSVLRRSLGSVYPLQPNPRWLERRGTFLVFVAIYAATALVCFLRIFAVVQKPLYSLLAVTLLCIRVRYYWRKGWILFFIDLCFVTTEVLIVAMWMIDWCSYEFLVAIYLNASGPVAGATFLLNIPLTFHHAEAFEAFFMHGTPMWLCFGLRWYSDRLPDHGLTKLQLIELGFTRFYLLWALAYMVFLLIQPHLPDKVAGLETLMDAVLFPDLKTSVQRREVKREKYGLYCCMIIAYIVSHAVLSISGFLAAALAFECWAVQVCWLIVVQIGGLALGTRFYVYSADERDMPGIAAGAVRMFLAWMVVAPTYFIFCK